MLLNKEMSNTVPTIWIEVEDAKAVYDKLKIKGVVFLSEPFRIRTGWAVEFTDPLSNRLGFTDYKPEKNEQMKNNEEIKATIIALEKQALELWNNGNPDGFLELSSDDVVYFDPVFEKKFVGKKALEEYYEGFRGKNKIDSYDMIEPIVQVMPECAVLMYDYEARREGQSYKMHCTEVYKANSSGQWKIIHTHWSFVMPVSK